MISPNELRIGNWVRDDIVNLRNVQVEHIDPSENFEDLSPILITKEWLVKFGFSLLHYEYIFPNKDYDFLCINNLDGDFLFYHGTEYEICTIYHVHQLQNLYFALTGEELTINQP